MKRYLLILLVMLAFITWLNGEKVVINSNTNSVELISSDNHSTILELNVESFLLY